MCSRWPTAGSSRKRSPALAALAHVQPVWVDLDAPTPKRKGLDRAALRPDDPDDAVDDDLEESARFYEEDNGELHIRSDFLIDDDEAPRNVRVAFILHQASVLFSVHGEDLPVFRLLRLRARRIPALIEDAKDVLLKLYDADAEYTADALEGIYDSLEAVSARVLQPGRQRPGAGEALSAIAKRGRPERPHPPQRDGHAPRGQLHDAQPHAQRRAVRGGAPDPARHRLARQPHAPSCSTRSTS